jgi:hypothetical protein
MIDPSAVEDDDVVLRHIPGGTLWQAPGLRITSANFQIRPDRGETGVFGVSVVDDSTRTSFRPRRWQ